MPRLPPRPRLDWSDPRGPRAADFDDVYFSREGGLAETGAVFLGGCGLPEAWAGKDRFVLGELGFGTGLNALAVWRAWKIARPAHAILHMFSIEAFPLAREEAARALGAYPELAGLTQRLLARWPVRAYAPQRLWFEEDGFALTLLTGEAGAALDGLAGGFDAWFLDGFAPGRNPAMWDAAVLARIAALSAPGARLATYSVAGAVRRGLEQAGFTVARKPGFGSKRERLEARLGAAAAPAAAARPARVAVIGAGVAGAAIAAALARRKVETVMLEEARELGAGASGNPAGLVMPRLDRGGALAELHLAAFLEAEQAYRALGPEAFTPCGVLQRPEARDAAAFADLAADPPLPEDWLAAREGGLWHPRAGLVRAQAAVRAWSAGAQLMCEAPVGALERVGGRWRLHAPDGRALLAADAVVLACGPALARFDAARALPLRITRGQIEWGPGAAPAHALARGSYCAPFEGGALFGATFDRQDDDAPAVASGEARARNLEALARLAPEVRAGLVEAKLSSRAALRAAMADFAPLAGAMPDAAAARAGGGAEIAAIEGLYVLGGLGARGLTLAPLLGECVAAAMCGEPQALSRRTLAAIDPARFLRRALKRRG